MTHDGRKEKEEEKETIALEVVTDGKNDKTKKNDKEYVHNKRTWDGTCVLFCVPPSFVLMDNKYILSCAHFLYGAHWMKAMKNWEWNSGVYIFIVLF